MMLAPTSIYRRFIASTRGVAAIEFAAIVPVLLVLLLTSFDAGNGIAAYMKVRAATYTLAAITNQYTTISTTQMTAITGATATVLSPYTGTTVVVLTQVKATSATAASVSWSYSPTSGAALTQISNLPTNFAQNTCNNNYPCYIILAQVSYTFTPTFGYFLSNSLTFSDSLYATPRSSECIQYNGTPSSC